MEDISSIPRVDWENNLDLWRTGMKITLPQLYVLPDQARIPHFNFVDRLKKRRWGFILVRGETGAGKSAYVRYVQDLANKEGYALARIDVDEKQVRQYSPAAYFNKEIVEKLRLPDGRSVVHTMMTDESFRQRLHTVVEANQATLSFWSPALTQAFLWATDSSDSFERKLARSWIRGEPKYVADLRQIGIFDPVMKSVLNVPSDKLLFFVREICAYLGHTGFLLTVDEIETLGNVSSVRGRQALSVLRDLINILTSEDSTPTRRGMAEGVFIIYAISTYFLGFSGIIPLQDAELKSLAEAYGVPNVRLGEVPRLDGILRHSASSVVSDFTRLEDLEAVASKVLLCYSHANDYSPQQNNRQLAEGAYQRTGRFVARENIQEMIRILDEERSSQA